MQLYPLLRKGAGECHILQFQNIQMIDRKLKLKVDELPKVTTVPSIWMFNFCLPDTESCWWSKPYIATLQSPLNSHSKSESLFFSPSCVCVCLCGLRKSCRHKQYKAHVGRSLQVILHLTLSSWQPGTCYHSLPPRGTWSRTSSLFHLHQSVLSSIYPACTR